MVGSSGASSERLRPETAKPLSLPARTGGSAVDTSPKKIENLSAEQIRDGLGIALVGHVQHVDAGHRLEKLCGHA